MGFINRENKPKAQVSLNSFSGAVGHVKDEITGAASAITGHVKDAVSSTIHHAKGATSFANKDLKHNMQHKSGRAIDN